MFDRFNSRVVVQALRDFTSGPLLDLGDFQIFDNGAPKTPTLIAIMAGVLLLTYDIDPIDDANRVIYTRGSDLFLLEGDGALDTFDLTVPFP